MTKEERKKFYLERIKDKDFKEAYKMIETHIFLINMSDNLSKEDWASLEALEEIKRELKKEVEKNE